MWRPKIPPIPVRKTQPRGAYQRPQGRRNSKLKERQIQENLIEEEQEEQNGTESIDPEAALYIKELTEDWAEVNHKAPEIIPEVTITTLNITLPNDLWIEDRNHNF